jgi:hypothetical protein
LLLSQAVTRLNIGLYTYIRSRMADKWNEWYKHLTKDDMGHFRYGNTETYELGYKFLQPCAKVEDWGCGAGGFRRLFTNGDEQRYIGVDGSKTPFSDIKADLTEYVSNVDGIFMRHILEHNYEWKQVLENACKSFRSRMCLILFTPFSDVTKEIAHNLQHGVDVPDMSFSKNDLTDVFTKYGITYELVSIQTSTGYSIEHVFYLKKALVSNMS